ncbi:MAG: carbohydrate ABC transporter permease [Propionibacteriaceae bacterium]|nr:carbohydrate ABC transporter permease [Propionibacteriaceae bacterium]
MKRPRNRRGWLSATISYTYLSVLAVAAVFPLLWVVLSSVKGKGELIADPTSFWPKEITFEYYRTVWDQLKFGTALTNSVGIALVTTVISLAFSALAAYGIVRFTPRFGKVVTRTMIATYMFPPILLAIPYSIILGQLKLTNSHLGLVLVYLSFSVPFAVWLLIGFFRTVPLEIEEAGYVDGAGRLAVFWRIVIPIVAPGLVAVAIYTFINVWNEFLYSLILINDTAKMTASVALKSLEGQEVLDWGTMMAASTLVVVPSVIFFAIIQNKIAGGLAQGSVK